MPITLHTPVMPITLHTCHAYHTPHTSHAYHTPNTSHAYHTPHTCHTRHILYILPLYPQGGSSPAPDEFENLLFGDEERKTEREILKQNRSVYGHSMSPKIFFSLLGITVRK